MCLCPTELYCVVVWDTSVSVFGGVVFGRDNETAAFARATVHRLYDIDHLLLVLKRPVDLVVVAGAKVDHDVFVAEKEHHRAWVVQLVPATEPNIADIKEHILSYFSIKSFVLVTLNFIHSCQYNIKDFEIYNF